jgi:hypothetical protein
MISIVKRSGYKAFGLRLLSVIPMPGLLPMAGLDEESADVIIEIGDLSALWFELAATNQGTVVKENLVMFQIKDLATFLVQDGRKIIVSPMKGSSQERISLFLEGHCMAIVLIQRSIIPLHGSAIMIEGKAYLIVGRSGAGKSTLTRVLIERGYSFLGDDVIPVSLSQENYPMVTPAFPEQKMWKEGLCELGMETSSYRLLYEKARKRENSTLEERTKFALPVHRYIDNPVPLGGVFQLVKTEEKEIGISSIEKIDRLETLINHTFRRTVIQPLGLMEWHFKTTTSIANKIKFYQLRRPASHFTAPELATLIEKTVQRECLYDYQ